jgi:hypothetical protein
MKQLGATAFCVGAICLSSLAYAQTGGVGGPSYAAPAGRSPTAPAVPLTNSPRAAPAPLQSSAKPSAARPMVNPSAIEFGTPIPGVTTK